VAVVPAGAIGLVGIQIGTSKIGTIYECVAARVTSKQSSCVVVVIYCLGSKAAKETFYAEFSQLLDQLVTMTYPLILAGDINIRLERVLDRNTQAFTGLMLDYVLVQHVCSATHRDGETLDVVCTRNDQPAPALDICNFGNTSDYSLLCWTSCLQRTLPVYVTSRRRSWRAFKRDVFKSDITASPLCDQTCWSTLDRDELSRLYDGTISTLTDKQICARTSQRRPLNVWLDDDCRQAKRLVWCKECTYRRKVPDATQAASSLIEWRDERRRYINFVKGKRSSFWTSRIKADQKQPRRLWKSFDEILGRPGGAVNLRSSFIQPHSLTSSVIR